VLLALLRTLKQVCTCQRSVFWRWLTSHHCNYSVFVSTNSVWYFPINTAVWGWH
jgi:hypothetical protein